MSAKVEEQLALVMFGIGVGTLAAFTKKNVLGAPAPGAREASMPLGEREATAPIALGLTIGGLIGCSLRASADKSTAG